MLVLRIFSFNITQDNGYVQIGEDLFKSVK